MKTTLLEAIAANSKLPEDLRNEAALEDFFPHGSGFDGKTKIISTSPQKIVVQTAFHHMDDNGYYCGWSHWEICITPTFLGPRYKTVCRGWDTDLPKHEHPLFREYLLDIFHEALMAEVTL